MSGSDVTRGGTEGARPGREALTGAMAGRLRWRRGRGERPLVPEAEFSYCYGLPILKKPTWQPLDIAGYL